MYFVPDLPSNLPVLNETVSDALPARRPKALPQHLPLKQEVLVPLGPCPALRLSQANNTKERKGNVPIVARWGISRQTKSVLPDSFLIILFLLLPQFQGRERPLPLLRQPGKGRKILLSRLMVTGVVDPDKLDPKASPTGIWPLLRVFIFTGCTVSLPTFVFSNSAML